MSHCDVLEGALYVVGTPIGNLEDMTLRAIATLKAVDVIAAEDTRHTAKLLNHFHISTPQVSYHNHNRLSRIPDLIARLKQGQTIALVSDAGMPGVSDPGYELVKACRDEEIPVIPIPGASAVITALSASGLNTDRFVFEGFLPSKGKERRVRLESIQTETRTLVFYEAPHRLVQTLHDLANTFGSDRAIVLAKELTKFHEGFLRGSIKDAIAYHDEHHPMGEYTLVIAGAETQSLELTDDVLRAELISLLKQGISRSHASRDLAQQSGIPRRRIYQLALTIADDEIDDDETRRLI